jgi:hypothetical protein
MSRIGWASAATRCQTPNDRGGPFVIGSRSSAAEAWVGDRHRKALAERLAQSDGKREPGEAAAGDQNVEIKTRHDRALRRNCRKTTGERHAAPIINSSLTDLLRGGRH